MTPEASQLDIRRIMEILPHRYPFLLVYRVLEVVPGERAVAIKNVTANEPQFTGHFPERPLMPGVLIVEALAQVGGIVLLHLEQYHGRLALFAGIDGVRFRRQVQPGDQLVMTAELLKLRGGIARVKVSARVDQSIVTEGELMFALVE